MSKAIVVEDLSKSYLLKHRTAQAQASTQKSLRDAIGSGLGAMLRGGRKRNAAAGVEVETEEVFWALRDINFEVEEGERVAIIGRNGAGKSTLLKILSRVVSPTSGSVRIRGRLSSLLEVGTGFHPELTGRENVFLNGALLGMSQAEVRRKFDEIINFAEIERFLDTPVKRYSSGMYVRLAFAVSAFLEPDIIVLDEVLAVGDAAFQKKCQAKMRQLAAEGRTVLFVSHSMGAVKEMCDTALILEGGRVNNGKVSVDEAVLSYMRRSVNTECANLPFHTEDVDCLNVLILQDEVPVTACDGSKPIDVQIEFRVHRPLQAFRMGFYLKTVLGEMIARSLAADWNPDMETVLPGDYVLHARLPADFLVAGSYVVEIHSSQFGVCDYFDSMLSFPITVRRSPGYNVQHAAEQPFGYVHLNPGWRLESLSLA
ncbi:phosphate ABC transporter ATPase [Cupriavidus sp. SK-4]|uniref:ABC transporter ATP-binding protein n=1 Tax=Cupriavidus sp. SK-4 TaxID=574750 RepID=UPI0004470C1C|nr:ABC transporter ATP-binding protein [Cupriavidus sp. SK-4]EYS96937.1 phosphate ABC transporter ATPase [Cupriavidus sp. SK-4]